MQSHKNPCQRQRSHTPTTTRDRVNYRFNEGWEDMKPIAHTLITFHPRSLRYRAWNDIYRAIKIPVNGLIHPPQRVTKLIIDSMRGLGRYEINPFQI